MPNHSNGKCDSEALLRSADRSLTSAVSASTYQKGYHQALDDFAIPNLLTCLKTYSDADFDAAWMNLSQPELESLAAILIRDLTANLKGKAIAFICSRSMSTVQGWFRRGGNYRRPRATDMRHLALMDFLLEHYENIPPELLNLLCPCKRNQ